MKNCILETKGVGSVHDVIRSRCQVDKRFGLFRNSIPNDICESSDVVFDLAFLGVDFFCRYLPSRLLDLIGDPR